MNIIMDIDGTLIDTSEADKKIFKEIYENAHINTDKPIDIIKKELDNTFSYPSYNWFDWNEKLKRIGCNLRFEDLNKKYGNLIKVYEDVVPILGKLKAEGNILYAMSDARESVQKIRLKAAGLSGYFNQLFTSDKCKTIKTDIKYFEFILKHVLPKDGTIVMVDDIEYPILPAKKAGLITIRLDRKNDVSKTDADYLIHSLKELVPIINTLIQQT